jgi:hypothetical protein
MGKWNLLKLFQEWGGRRNKGEYGVGEFKYDIFDVLWELLEMPEYTPSTTIKKETLKKPNKTKTKSWV